LFTVSSWNSKRKTSAALLLLLLLLLAEELQGIKKKVLWALAILEQILFTTVFLGIQRRNLQLLILLFFFFFFLQKRLRRLSKRCCELQQF
jgi:hypothetical protein